jgi:hypothetical protein
MTPATPTTPNTPTTPATPVTSTTPATPARHAPSAARLLWLYARSRRAPAALVALAACGLVLWVALHYHWWFGSGPAADEMPTLLEGGAAAIIAVTTHNVFGEPERATGRWLPYLRFGVAIALCGAAIGSLAIAAAIAYDPQAYTGLYHGMLPVERNVLGFTGIGLLLSVFIGGLLSWIGPITYTAICQFAAIANYSEPLTWASRPGPDRGGWIAATVAFAVGLAAFTIRGPRTRPSGE